MDHLWFVYTMSIALGIRFHMIFTSISLENIIKKKKKKNFDYPKGKLTMKASGN